MEAVIDDVMEGGLPTIEEFTKLCEDHDWTFGYSDDHRAWKKGNEERKYLMKCIRYGGTEYMNIYTDEAARRPYG